MLPGKRDSGILAVVLCQAQNFLLSLQAGYTEILRALFDILTVDLVITEKYTKLSMFYLVLFFFYGFVHSGQEICILHKSKFDAK